MTRNQHQIPIWAKPVKSFSAVFSIQEGRIKYGIPYFQSRGIFKASTVYRCLRWKQSSEKWLIMRKWTSIFDRIFSAASQRLVCLLDKGLRGFVIQLNHYSSWCFQPEQIYKNISGKISLCLFSFSFSMHKYAPCLENSYKNPPQIIFTLQIKIAKCCRHFWRKTDCSDYHHGTLASDSKQCKSIYRLW